MSDNYFSSGDKTKKNFFSAIVIATINVQTEGYKFIKYLIFNKNKLLVRNTLHVFICASNTKCLYLIYESFMQYKKSLKQIN